MRIAKIFFLFFFATPALAEHTIALSIRTFEVSKSTSPYFDERLHDIKKKLEKLPFNNFKINYAASVPVSLNKESRVQLTDGQLLVLRVLYTDKNRMGFRVNWLDRYGSELLNTQMHFSPKESMLAGVEEGKDSGTMLAIGLQ